MILSCSIDCTWFSGKVDPSPYTWAELGRTIQAVLAAQDVEAKALKAWGSAFVLGSWDASQLFFAVASWVCLKIGYIPNEIAI